MKTRAYSILNIKAVDDSQRVFRGMATTPSADRVGDVIDPLGCEFRNPSPLLWMHQHDLPVGTVKFGKPTKEGVPFEATIPQIDNPAGLKARVDEAWSSVLSGLISAVSIGFRALEWSINETTGGYNFLKTELLELSLVSVPANRDATITGIKSFDTEIRKAASGNKAVEVSKSPPSGVSEKTVKLTPKEGKNTMNIGEQIKNFQNERGAKAAKMQDIMAKTAETGETLDETQAEEFDTLKTEIEAIDKHLGRLEATQKMQIATAKPVTEKSGRSERAATETRQHSTVRVNPTEEKGIAFARVVKCIGMSKGNLMQAAEIAEKSYSQDQRIGNIIKAAVVAGSTASGNWANPLVSAEGAVFADFVEFLRPQTILGKFGQGNIPALRRVPFRVPLVGQTSGGQGYWVGESKAKPMTKFDFSRTTLTPLKVANIAALTMEVLRDSSPSSEILVRDGLADALRARLDTDFIDPAKAASAGVSPASITNGVTPITSSGATADDIRADVKALMATFIAANNAPTNGVWIMSATTALALSLMTNPLGQPEFTGITMNGGTFLGMPVIVSEYVPSDTAGGLVALVNASDVYLADDGEISVDMSDQASLEMSDSPTQNGSTPTASTMVSLWQNNLVGFRAERTINFSKRRASAVAVLDGVTWGAAA